MIGGDAAGMSAASKVRRSLPDAQVVVFERTKETSYGACGLPYYIGGVNDDADKIRIRKPEAFLASGIDLRIAHEAVAVDAVRQTVTARNLSTGELVEESYEELVVASGAAPILPPIRNRDKEGVFALKSIADAEAIRRLGGAGGRRGRGHCGCWLYWPGPGGVLCPSGEAGHHH